MHWKDLSPAEALTFLREHPDWIVLDVRTPREFEWHRIEGAMLLPIQQLEERLSELDRTRSYAVVCEHGVRSEAACAFLASNGFHQLLNIAGGMAPWVDSGLPFVSGPAQAPTARPTTPEADRQKPTRQNRKGLFKRLFGG